MKYINLRKLIAKEKVQILTFAAISLVIIVFTGILSILNPLSFQSFLGNFNPLIIMPILAVLGIFIVIFLLMRKWFVVFNRENLKAMFLFYIPAIILPFFSILIDIFFKYPKEIHKLVPESLFFYPVMGYVAEIVFHMAPLSLLLFTLNLLFKSLNFEKGLWFSISIVSLIEPLFQTTFSPSHFPLWITIFSAVHLYVFNFLQLYLIKRYDFLSMYSFRLVYYMIWHIIWGSIRINILF